MAVKKFDVAIIGGGLAGNLLARQLHQNLSHLTIGLFEKNRSTSFKVGESTVEIASNYLIRRLSLSTYLYEHHLPKNGLRFFFDSQQKDVDLPHMSEIGGVAFPYHPSFQLDRARLENDLHAMNQENGISVYRGTTVSHLQIMESSTGTSEHHFKISSEEGEHECCARWFIDASGRHAVLAKKLRLRSPEPTHEQFAVWGRFRGVADWDAGPDAFRKRIRYSSRMLSTNHFCYPGYWIWFIPLGRGITSIGVVGDIHSLGRLGLSSQKHFLTFLGRHQAVTTFLGQAEMLDIGSHRKLAYNTKQYFSANCWGLTGESAVFTDPFYSPGSDFIALENDFLTDLIIRDTQGISFDKLCQLSDLYNQYMRFRYESSLLLYRDLYSTLGSFELFKLKWQFDFALYYHWWLSQYLQDLHLNEAFLRSQLEEQHFVFNALTNFSSLFKAIETHIKRTGHYYHCNRKQFSDSLEGMNHIEHVGLPQPGHTQLKRLTEIFNRIYSQGVGLLEGTTNSVPHDALPLSRFTSSHPLV